MPHFFEKTIVDAKDIYTDYLINVLQPLLYEGFQSLYEKAMLLEKNYLEATKIDPNVKNPGIVILFQYFLLGLDKLNDSLIEDEAKRIRDNSKCADIFDDLVKAVIKSHIIVLTYTSSGKRCKIIDEKLHEKVEIKSFLHKCYVECSRIFYDHPMLFWHEFQSSEIKENQRIIYQLIKVGIRNAIKRSLPMKAILEEYLKNDYIEDEENEDEYIKVKDLLNRDLNNKNQVDEGGIMKIIDSDTSMDNNLLKLDQGADDLSSLIYNRKILDTLEGTINTPKPDKISPHVPTLNSLKTKNDIKSPENKNNIKLDQNEHISVKSDKFNKLENLSKNKKSSNMMAEIVANAKKTIQNEENENINIIRNNDINVVRNNDIIEGENYFGIDK